jgi:Protein of unknown function (DUF3302)
MIDVFDIMAFAVFGILLVAAVVLVVGVGSLPGRIALKRGHPQAAAINVTSWLGIATLGLLWPIALIWAFLKPHSITSAAFPENQARVSGQDAQAELSHLQWRVAALEADLKKLELEKERRS